MKDRARPGLPRRGRPRTALITYGDLCVAADPEHEHWVGPRDRGIGKALLAVSLYEWENGRPLLSVLVVRKGAETAGTGFWEVLAPRAGLAGPPGGEYAFWREHLERVVSYWTTAGEPAAEGDRVAQARQRLDAVVAEVAAIRELLTQPA